MKKDVRRGYAERRRREYPSLSDQLDMIFHNGLDAWREQIAEIKGKHPKPPEKNSAA